MIGLAQKEARALSAEIKKLIGLTCLLCEQPPYKALPICRACRKELQPTPLDQWLSMWDVSEEEFVEGFCGAVGVSAHSFRRACDGERVSPKIARALSSLTGIPYETFRPARARAPRRPT